MSAVFANVNGQRICFSAIGSGPPLLLLHGFPQTHVLWRRVGELLSNQFTVIAPDLRGYGDSSKPQGTENYTFRHMAQDQLALMQHLGFVRFHVAGHDRGGRVAHRLALDAPDQVLTLSVMDIVPTHLLLDQLSRQVATAYYHWFFLAQPAPFPETMIGHDPNRYFESCLLGWGAAKLADFDPGSLAAYRRAWGDPDTIRGMCADYRAALHFDFDLDAQDLERQVLSPALVLYGAEGAMAKAYDVPSTWQHRLSQMQARAIPGGHFFVDQSPEPTARALSEFIAKT